MTALEGLKGLVIVDEVQRKPEIFEILRVLADRPRSGTRFLLLGSASPHLVKGVSESLAGRVAFVDMSGFSLREVGSDSFRRLWNRGCFPRSYLARNDKTSYEWRNDFVRTFLERDVPQLGISIPSETLRRFWTMVAHYHGQIWNAAEFARSLGSSEPTARRYLDLLCGGYVTRRLQPWHENLKKRQVKSPKVYVRDTGLLHALLSLPTPTALSRHPKLGASWEGFGVEQILNAMGTRDAYFWATHAGAELDLLVFEKGKRLGFEVKYVDAPSVTKSTRVALEDLRLDTLHIVYPGAETYRLDKRVRAVSILDVLSLRLVGT
jgi:predicted AAA+ superfamily ATPase